MLFFGTGQWWWFDQFLRSWSAVSYQRSVNIAPTTRAFVRASRWLAALSGDEQLVIFSRLCNPLDPGVAVAFSSASNELWELTQADRQKLQADHEAAAAPQGREVELQGAARGEVGGLVPQGTLP